MSRDPANAATYMAMIERMAPEYLDLLTARTSEEFDAAFDALLSKAVTRLEANKTHYLKLTEEGLSSILAASLSIPGFTVTQETNSNGHVDLTFEGTNCLPMRRKLGEAKIYDGPAYHLKGLRQLLDRYTTGREESGLLVVYFRKHNIAGLVTKIRTQMDADLPCEQQGMTTDHPRIPKWCFLSTHKLTSGDNHQVGHIGCNLFIE